MKPIKSAAVKKVASATKTKTVANDRNKLKTPESLIKKDVFNVHLVVPSDAGLDAKNVKVTMNGLQIVIELQSNGGLVANQVEGVKKVPAPPPPRKPIEDLLKKLRFRFTISKEAIR